MAIKPDDQTRAECEYCKCSAEILEHADPECSQNHWGPHSIVRVQRSKS